MALYPDPSPFTKFAEALAREVRENEVLKARISRLEAALIRIANQDYRGNRSHESEIARQALKEQA